MSTAVSEPSIHQKIIEQPIGLELVSASQGPTLEEFADPHPLLPVFFAAAFALLLAGTFVGSIVIWLVLRNSGVAQ